MLWRAMLQGYAATALVSAVTKQAVLLCCFAESACGADMLQGAFWDGRPRGLFRRVWHHQRCHAESHASGLFSSLLTLHTERSVLDTVFAKFPVVQLLFDGIRSSHALLL